MIPFSFLFINIFESLQKNSLKYLKIFSYFLLIYILVLFLHWPFMWELNFTLSNFIDIFKVTTEIKVFFQELFIIQQIYHQSYYS